MSKAGLEAMLEELRRARGLDLSNYRRAPQERRPILPQMDTNIYQIGKML